MVLRRTALERTESGGRNGSSGRKERKIGNRNHDSPGTLESDSMVFYSSFYRQSVPTDLQYGRCCDRRTVSRSKGTCRVGATGAMSFLVLGFATGHHQRVFCGDCTESGAEDREQIRISVAGLLLAVYSSDCSDDDFKCGRGRFPSSDHEYSR